MGTPTGRTLIVTDSTAMLPPEVAAERGIVVVPLQVVIGATVYDEGTPDGATPELVADALKEWAPVSTSRPAPAVLQGVYEQAARDGATSVLSLHLSGEMSGTFESAQLASRDSPIPVTVVDSRQVGVATGFAGRPFGGASQGIRRGRQGSATARRSRKAAIADRRVADRRGGGRLYRRDVQGLA